MLEKPTQVSRGMAFEEGDWINTLKNKVTKTKKLRALTTKSEERCQVIGAHGDARTAKIGGCLPTVIFLK